MALDNPGLIDAVRETGAGAVELVLQATGAWDGSDHRQILLQEKLNRYLEFVVDGELSATVAGPAPKGWMVVVEHDQPLDPRTIAYLRHADGEFRRQGGGVAIRSLRPPAG